MYRTSKPHNGKVLLILNRCTVHWDVSLAGCVITPCFWTVFTRNPLRLFWCAPWVQVRIVITPHWTELFLSPLASKTLCMLWIWFISCSGQRVKFEPFLGWFGTLEMWQNVLSTYHWWSSGRKRKISVLPNWLWSRKQVANCGSDVEAYIPDLYLMGLWFSNFFVPWPQ